MQLMICVLFAWLTIVMFSLIPKRLLLLDFVFLYSVILIMTSVAFTVFDVNNHIVTIPRTPTISFSSMICRVVTIPLVLMMAVNSLQSFRGKKPRWFMAISIWLGITVFDWVLDLLKVITYHKSFVWHIRSTLISYLAFIVIAWAFAWLYARLDGKNVGKV